MEWTNNKNTALMTYMCFSFTLVIHRNVQYMYTESFYSYMNFLLPRYAHWWAFWNHLKLLM